MRKSDTRIAEGWGLPEQVASEEQWTWIHCVPGAELHMVILSEKPSTWIAHWFGPKRRACKGNNCMFCARQSKPVRRYVVSVWDLDLRGRCVFEFGEPTMADFASLLDGGDNGRGLVVRIYKDGRSKRSRICARVLDGGAQLVRDEFGDQLTEEINLPLPQPVKPIVKNILERMEAEELGESATASPPRANEVIRSDRSGHDSSIAPAYADKVARIRKNL